MRITVDEFIAHGTIDVCLLDNDGNFIEYKQGLNYDTADNYISHLYHNYDLKDDTQMTGNVFNDDEKLVGKHTVTIGEYMEM